MHWEKHRRETTQGRKAESKRVQYQRLISLYLSMEFFRGLLDGHQLNQKPNHLHRCSQGCSNVNKRKRRDVTRDEIEHEESTNKYILTQGPLVFKEPQQAGGKLKAFMLHCVFVSSLNVVVVGGLFLTYTLFMLSRRLHATRFSRIVQFWILFRPLIPTRDLIQRNKTKYRSLTRTPWCQICL